MSSDEDKIAEVEAELQECCTAISAELDKVHMHRLTCLLIHVNLIGPLNF